MIGTILNVEVPNVGSNAISGRLEDMLLTAWRYMDAYWKVVHASWLLLHTLAVAPQLEPAAVLLEVERLLEVDVGA